jgi:hypothetical protein
MSRKSKRRKVAKTAKSVPTTTAAEVPAAPAASDSIPLPNFHGAQGGPEAGQTSDSRLIERAIKEEWPVPEQYRPAIISRQARIAIDPKSSSREASVAARTLMRASEINLRIIELQMPKPATGTQSVNVGIRIDQTTIRDALHEPDDLDYLEGLRDAGAVRVNGEPGPVSDSQAYPSDQPSHPGNHNGNGNGHNGHSNGHHGSNGHNGHSNGHNGTNGKPEGNGHAAH